MDPALDPSEAEHRWQALAEHRPALVRLARRRCPAEDAEDAVQTALADAFDAPGLDLQKPLPLLVTILFRRIADGWRRQGRQTSLSHEPVLEPARDEAVEDVVCDRAQAQWLAEQLSFLQPRERQALELRAQGLSYAAIAGRLDATGKAVEALVGRARARLRRRDQADDGADPVEAAPGPV